MAGVCPNAYGNKAFNDESTCRSVKCRACMLIGDGFQDGMVTAEHVGSGNCAQENPVGVLL